MRRAIPPIAEHADDLKQRLQREHDGRKHVRVGIAQRTPRELLVR
jgi:hypothetical protein